MVEESQSRILGTRLTSDIESNFHRILKEFKCLGREKLQKEDELRRLRGSVNSLSNRLSGVFTSRNESAESVILSLKQRAVNAEKYKGKYEEVCDKMRSVHLRCLGMKHIDYDGQNQDMAHIIENIFELLDGFQDERDTFVKEHEFSVEKANHVRSALVSVEERLRSYLNARIPSGDSDEILVKYVNCHLDQILGSNFNRQYMRIDELRSCLSHLELDDSKSLEESLSEICGMIDDYRVSVNVFSGFSEMLSDLYRSFRLQPEYLWPRNGLFGILVDNMAKLREIMDNVVENSINPTFYNVLSKFMWLSQGLASHISAYG
jgi:hypothetical protein